MQREELEDEEGDGDDDDEDYKSDFEKEASDAEDEEEETTHAKRGDTKFSKKGGVSSSVVITKNAIEEKELENPLVRENKFFFVRSQLKKYQNQASKQYSAPESLEMNAVEFAKTLSTFISLETVLVASSSLQSSSSFLTH